MIIKLSLNIDININAVAFAILLVASCFLLDSLYIDTEMLTTPMVSYEKFEEIAQTGDLVIFRWNTIDVGFRLFSKFSHVGMIVKHKGKLYLLETHPKEIPESEIDDSGIHLYHLKNRLEEYYGNYYFTQLNTSTKEREILRKHILDNLKMYKKKIPFDTNFRNMFVLNYFYNLFNIKLAKKESMFCSEFIGTILEICKIYKHHKNISSINPGTFLEFKKKNGSNLYGPLYDILIS
jgi:hypothetical protein